MVATRAMIAFVAGTFALSVGSFAATASDRGVSSTKEEETVQNHGWWLPGIGNFPTSVSGPLDQILSGFLNLGRPSGGFPSIAASSVTLFIPKEDPKKCRVAIQAGADVTKEKLSLTFKSAERTVVASFQDQAIENKHSPEMGDSRSSRTVQSTSTLLLPKHCLVNAAVLLNHMGGYIIDFDSDGAGRTHRGLVVLPSALMLRDYVDQGLLPPGIIDSVTGGDKQDLDQLTPEQRCLAAGFTSDECRKIGNKKPEVEIAAPYDNVGDVSIPLYQISLQMLD